MGWMDRDDKPADNGIELNQDKPVTTPEPAKVKGEVVDVDSELKAIARRVRSTAKKLAESYLALGSDLSRAQILLANGKNGTFLKWLKTVGVSRSAAYRAIECFNRIGNIPNVGKFVEVEAVRKLGSAPEVVVQKVVKMVDQGERVDSKMVSGLIAKHSKPKSSRPMPTVIETEFGTLSVVTRGTATTAQVINAAVQKLRQERDRREAA